MQYYIFFFFFNYICNLNLNCKAVFMYDIVFFFLSISVLKTWSQKTDKKKKTCDGRESNPDQLLGRQLC